MAKVNFIKPSWDICQKATYLNFMQVKVGSNEKKNSEKDLTKIEASFAGGK